MTSTLRKEMAVGKVRRNNRGSADLRAAFVRFASRQDGSRERGYAVRIYSNPREGSWPTKIRVQAA